MNPAFCMNVFLLVVGVFLQNWGRQVSGSGAVICSGSSQLLDALRENGVPRNTETGSPAALAPLLPLAFPSLSPPSPEPPSTSRVHREQE